MDLAQPPSKKPVQHDLTLDYLTQFMTANANGWIDYFIAAADQYKFPAEILVAIGSRESGLTSVIGDGGRGYGIMQVDVGSYPAWCMTEKWKDVNEAVRMGTSILYDWQVKIVSHQGKKITFARSGKSFVAKDNLSAAEILKTTIAAYNTGWNAYADLTFSGDVDRQTTGRNYSSDVLVRSLAFAQFLKEQTLLR